MIIIYGLGNNEPKYLDTKHNVGRVVVEQLAKLQGLTFTKVKSVMVAKSSEVQYVYSLDYMNTSGNILNEYIQFIKPQDLKLYIIQDDSDQIILNSKIVLGGGTAGHNGITDIYKYLLNWGTNLSDIVRLKIGIRPVNNTSKSLVFVLSKTNKEEQEYLANLTNQLSKNIELITKNNIPKLQNIINTK